MAPSRASTGSGVCGDRWSGGGRAAPRVRPAEPPPETARIRFSRISSICLAPQYAAEELLRGEGFTDIQYLNTEAGRALMDDTGPYQALAAGKVDLNGGMVGELIARIAAGDPVVILGGIQAGRFEVFWRDRVHSLAHL